MTIDELIERLENKAILMNSKQAKEEWLILAGYFEELKELRKIVYSDEAYIKGRADAIQELKDCKDCKYKGKWENELEYGYPSPCTDCRRRRNDNYEPLKEPNDKYCGDCTKYADLHSSCFLVRGLSVNSDTPACENFKKRGE